MHDPDNFPEDPQQKELPLPPLGPITPSSVENLQKHFQELQARFQEHVERASLTSALWQEQYLHLRKLLSGTLAALLFLLLGVCLFLGKQMRNVRAQLEQQRPFVMQSVSEFESRIEPNLKNFANQLQTFAATHPDFRPIIDAYRGPLAHYFTLIRPALPDLPKAPTNAPPKPSP
jgi:hypothetical protein